MVTKKPIETRDRNLEKDFIKNKDKLSYGTLKLNIK